MSNVIKVIISMVCVVWLIIGIFIGRDITQGGNDNLACFQVGDPGVTEHFYSHDGEIHQAWLRSTDARYYWADDTGRWGIVDSTYRLPWLEIPTEADDA